MTQVDLDADVLTIADKAIDRMVIVAALRRQGDPKARELEEQQMMIFNVLYALRDYDITSDVMTDSDIKYLFELAQQVLEINT